LTVAFDTTFLLYLFAPDGEVGVPLDENGIPIEFVVQRVKGHYRPNSCAQ